jgi:hypothetical protein
VVERSRNHTKMLDRGHFPLVQLSWRGEGGRERNVRWQGMKGSMDGIVEWCEMKDEGGLSRGSSFFMCLEKIYRHIYQDK